MLVAPPDLSNWFSDASCQQYYQAKENVCIDGRYHSVGHLLPPNGNAGLQQKGGLNRNIQGRLLQAAYETAERLERNAPNLKFTPGWTPKLKLGPASVKETYKETALTSANDCSAYAIPIKPTQLLVLDTSFNASSRWTTKNSISSCLVTDPPTPTHTIWSSDNDRRTHEDVSVPLLEQAKSHNHTTKQPVL
ncbi:hypothetical protein T265_06121 [Opisthorchis viverrini]|uniref:Uncharacterized protein n=1 Tax=Opisthorchis viverrini TaxID=6198 RepID=A0A074ZHH2_OPIVI|nr:hypothetical protein T265_06121 [Opisthorchis viverrini]KER26688.1 hypothetical protein T265_06121 [Opisthorchis viverrini]